MAAYAAVTEAVLTAQRLFVAVGGWLVWPKRQCFRPVGSLQTAGKAAAMATDNSRLFKFFFSTSARARDRELGALEVFLPWQ